ncbi:hypothetical protein Rt10032_c14g5353 [Rhodotorula toruloides]|uniref:Proteophosphoglycan ppg4 n=1 Tax=Rhodotorula toruloides TaxID=5286 RepID=A0A511KN97_RHOTO|nr:hypothetical protein Rt10032_c14g5353 [Rhodotorula toruloides]
MPFQRTCWLARAATFTLLLLGFATNGANAQGLTTLTQENKRVYSNGQVVTTSIPATVYTTENQVFTWQPTTPPTPAPSIVSHGSVLNVQDYISTVSHATGMPSSASRRGGFSRGSVGAAGAAVVAACAGWTMLL